MRVHRLLLLGFFVFLAAAGSAVAQSASIIGTVTDQTKAVLPGATITATNLETGAQATAVSSQSGEFRLHAAGPRDVSPAGGAGGLLDRHRCRPSNCWSARMPRCHS